MVRKTPAKLILGYRAMGLSETLSQYEVDGQSSVSDVFKLAENLKLIFQGVVELLESAIYQKLFQERY